MRPRLKTDAAARAVSRAWARAKESAQSLRFVRAPRGFAHACVCAVLLFAWAPPATLYDAQTGAASFAQDEDESDEALRRAALSALGGREGTVMVLDARTGRVRAVVNPRLAYEETFAPGSTIKPFTMLAALDAGIVGEDSHVFCRQPFRHEDLKINCAHPPSKTAFGPAEALAFSCNYFFGRAGERMDGETFARTLARFGFGAPTGGGAGREAAGQLPARGRWRVADALGESEQLLVTPAQLAAAYAALFNGGRLFAPRPAPSSGYAPRERARLEVGARARALLLEGMRGAVAYGTAARADLNTLPAYVFGKTGTSTPPGDFRTQGWFVGFDADAGAGGEDEATPDSIGLCVLVFLKRGHGSEAADIARPVFREHARIEEALRAAREASRRAEEATAEEAAGAGGEGRAGSPPTSTSPGDDTPPAPGGGAGVVRVHLSRADRTLALPLDEYVFGVLAAEASVETEPEAFKAQAVVSRTYALKNLRRHAREGFDFCSSTHCQRYVQIGDGSARPDFYEQLRRAVFETSGETLRDREGRLAESYFSASCGGATANLKTLWGAAHAPPHLRGVRDDFCAGTAYRAWEDVIPTASLLRALRSDARSDVGARLDGVRVVRRDASGRAELVALEGERRRVVRGWDFKLIVGRTLGWNVLKSSRFAVTRAGGSFVFRGSGFGHGLGLCQSGAHVMARRGASYRHIVGQFFPGATVGTREKRSAGLEQEDAAIRDATSYETTTYGTKPEPREAGGTTPSFADDAPSPTLFRRAAFSVSPAQPQANEAPDAHLDKVPEAHLDKAPEAHSDKVSGAYSNIVPGAHSNVAPESRLPRQYLSGEHFRASYPPRVARREIEAMLRTLDAARRDVLGRLESAGVNTGGVGTAELYVHETTGNFTATTGQPAWVAASTRGRRVETQPPDVLRRRGVLSTTLRHEFVHVALETLGRGRAPLWLVEGLAAHVAGEGAMLARASPGKKLSVEEIERGLARRGSAREMRALYAAAHAEVGALIRREGEAAVWRRAVRGG